MFMMYWRSWIPPHRQNRHIGIPRPILSAALLTAQQTIVFKVLNIHLTEEAHSLNFKIQIYHKKHYNTATIL